MGEFVNFVFFTLFSYVDINLYFISDYKIIMLIMLFIYYNYIHDSFI